MNIEIPYTPRKWAEELHFGTTRWKVLVLHRRAGKTTAVLNHLQRDALTVPKSQYAYIAPTYKQAERIAWGILKDISAKIPGIKPNEAKLILEYPNGSKIFLAGSENVDSLRGVALWGGCQDEASQHTPELFSAVISKCLADHLGYWIWAGTPQGRNEFYRTYLTAKGSKDWTAIFRTIDDSIRDERGQTIKNLQVALADDKKLVEQGIMTHEEFLQEWYCSFDAAIKGAYYATELSNARKDRIGLFPADPGLPVYTVWDLGIGPNMAIGFVQKHMGTVRFVDYWEGSGEEGLPEAIQMVKSKKYIYSKHFAPHDITTVDIGTGITRLETARKLGITFDVIEKLPVQDGIDSVKRMFPRIYFHEPSTTQIIDSLAQYRRKWDEKRGMFLQVPYHDWTSHAADVVRYTAIVEKKMTSGTVMPAPTVGFVQPFYPGIG